MSLVGAAAIQAGGNILGGLLGGGSSSKPAAIMRAQDRRLQKRQFKQAQRFAAKWNRKSYRYAQQQARKGVRLRVRDARSAGLHPLFALGGNVPGGAPSFGAGPQPNYVGGPNGLSASDSEYSFGDALGDVADAASGFLTARHARQVAAQQLDMQMRSTDSQVGLNDAMADYYRSLEAKAVQDMSIKATPVADPRADVQGPFPLEVLPQTIREDHNLVRDEAGNITRVPPDGLDEVNQTRWLWDQFMQNVHGLTQSPGDWLQYKINQWERDRSRARDFYRRAK